MCAAYYTDAVPKPATTKSEDHHYLIPPYSNPEMCSAVMAKPRARPRIFGPPYMHAVLMYINQYGELGLEASPSMSNYVDDIFPQDIFQKFRETASVASQSEQQYKNGLLLKQSLPIAQSVPPIGYDVSNSRSTARSQLQPSLNSAPIYSPSWNRPNLSRTSEINSYECQSQQRKRKRRSNANRSNAGHQRNAVSDGSVSPRPTISQVSLKVGDTTLLRKYYNKAFDAFQQLNCKVVAKAFVKVVEPRKQVSHPYNGRIGPFQRVDPDLTKPKWWPAGVTHKEPDHLLKVERIRLLVHVLCELKDNRGITVEKLREASQSLRSEISPAERLDILDEIYRVREMEESYLRREIDADTAIPITQVYLAEAAVEIPEYNAGVSDSTPDASSQVARIKVDTPSVTEEGHKSPSASNLNAPSLCTSGSSNTPDGREVPYPEDDDRLKPTQHTQDICFRVPPPPPLPESSSGKSTPANNALSLYPQVTVSSVTNPVGTARAVSEPREIHAPEPLYANVPDYFAQQMFASTPLLPTDLDTWNHSYHSPMSYPYDFEFS